MGQRDAFSPEDVEKVNRMYKCPNVGDNVDEIKPPMNSHNNINELIGESEEATVAAATTGNPPASPNRPNRPNRPLLNLFGSLISQALSQG